MTAAVLAMRAHSRGLDAGRELAQLAKDWPLGRRVRHLSTGLPGEIVGAVPEFPVAAYDGEARAVVCWHGGRPVTVVAVAFTFDGGFTAVAWYRPWALRRGGAGQGGGNT